MPELLTKAAYARHRGVGKSAVSNWINRDQIVLVDGKVDVAASDARLGAMVDAASGRDPAPANAAKKSGGAAAERQRPEQGARATARASNAKSGSDSVANSDAAQLAQERLAEIRERRIGHSLKNAEIAGTLVPIAAFEARLQTMISGFCERMQSELRAGSEALALETDKRKVRGMLDDMIHKVRSDFADAIEAGVEEEDDEADG